MGFVNINKVNLESTDDCCEAMASAVLMFSSLMYDCAKQGKHEEARGYIGAIIHSASSVDYVFSQMNEEKNK